MQRPKPRIVGVECDHHPMPGRHQDCVAHSAGKLLVVDFHDLKFMPVEMHRVRHRRLIDEQKLDALASAMGSGGVSLVQATLLSDQI